MLLFLLKHSSGKKGKGNEQTSMRDVPVEKIAEYAAEDADVTLQLKENFAPKLKSSGVQKFLMKWKFRLFLFSLPWRLKAYG